MSVPSEPTSRILIKGMSPDWSKPDDGNAKPLSTSAILSETDSLPGRVDREEFGRVGGDDLIRVEAEGHAANASVSSSIRGVNRSPKTWAALPMPPCSVNGV